MQENLVGDKLSKANTFSSGLLRLDSDAFPEPPAQDSPKAHLASDLFAKDEESEFFLHDSLASQLSGQGPPGKASRLLMFFNICRSFIAIGVLAVPFGLSKIGRRRG